MLSLIASASIGCDQEAATPPPTPQPVKIHSLKMIYPPEARGLMIGATERFNAKNIPLANGAVVRVASSSFDDLASVDKIGTPQTPAMLWLAPLSSLAVDSSMGSTTGATFTNCASVMSSPLGVAYRPIDRFALPKDPAQLSIRSVLEQQGEATAPRLAVVTGAPRFTSSGLLTALATASFATSTPIENLTPDSITKGQDSIRATQSSIRNYFISDFDTLSWIHDRKGGDPLVALTTEHLFKDHQRYNPKTTLEWSAIASPTATLDYPLCTVVSTSDSAQDVEAAKLVREFVTGKEFHEMATSYGFAPARTHETTNPHVSAAARTLISLWPQIRRPSLTVFVIDASIKTDRPTMETIKREVKMFIESRPSQNDSIALISASSNPEILSEPQVNGELLNIALSKATTSGGNAIRDGIQTAFTIFTDLTSHNYRRSVVVFTSSKDTSSQTSITQLTNRASQLVGRKNVDLFVIGFGSSKADFGDIPALTKEVGGTFIRTSIANLPADFYPIARRMQ
jgi:Mg-chelatase subunit ChlD